MITAGHSSGVEIRIRVAYDSGEEPCELFFDVRTGDGAEFHCIGSVLTSLRALTHRREETTKERESYPVVWRRQFRTYGQAMGRLRMDSGVLSKRGRSVRRAPRQHRVGTEM